MQPAAYIVKRDNGTTQLETGLCGRVQQPLESGGEWQCCLDVCIAILMLWMCLKLVVQVYTACFLAFQRQQGHSLASYGTFPRPGICTQARQGPDGNSFLQTSTHIAYFVFEWPLSATRCSALLPIQT
jgi:hypothetical protein